MSQPTLPPLAERVAEGAALLDVREPGWHEAIDPEQVSPYRLGRVLLDHLAARFHDGDLAATLAALSDTFASPSDPGAGAWLVAHGLDPAPSNAAAKQLGRCWQAEVRRRQARPVPDGPIGAPPGGFVAEAERRALLARPLGGIVLGAYDRRILGWLAGWDTPTVLTVASLLGRARAAVPSAAPAGLQPGDPLDPLAALADYLDPPDPDARIEVEWPAAAAIVAEVRAARAVVRAATTYRVNSGRDPGEAAEAWDRLGDALAAYDQAARRGRSR